MIRIELAREIQSANAFVNRRGFGGSRAYAMDRDAWRVLLRAQFVPRTPPAYLVRVQIVSYRGRILDHANLVGGCKGMIDCLKVLGLIHDDAPKWFRCTYDQTQVPRAMVRTVLIVHDHD